MIGPKILDEIKREIAQLLDEHLDLIDQAYLKSESGLTIAIPVKIRPHERPEFQEVNISLVFVAHKVSKKIRRILSESQAPLFRDGGISKVTISSGDKSVTLTAKNRKKIDAALAKDPGLAKEESRNAGS
jgi:siroheme synthase (precorrin-2 oxidase/ferrochelatase)